MSPVIMTVLPHNGRMTIDPAGSESELGAFATLPIPMPRTAMAWVGKDGKPIVLWCDDTRIHPADFATVLHGIEQYNNDCRHRGVTGEPPPVNGTDDEGDEDGDGDLDAE